MAEHFVEILCEEVNKANDFNDLCRIMPHIAIDLRDIQEMMKQRIRTLSAAAARKAVFNVMPIDSLLSMDSLQHVVE